MSERIPCPFCRWGLHEIKTRYDAHAAAAVYWVKCCACKSRGPEASSPNGATMVWNLRKRRPLSSGDADIIQFPSPTKEAS